MAEAERKGVREWLRTAALLIYFKGLNLLLSSWIPGPHAAGIALAVVLLVIYWMPPKPRWSYLKWSGMSILLGIGMYVLGLVWPWGK
jgi:hypothetical protein